MASQLVKKVMLKIVADDGDSEAKLDKITAKAEELKRLHPDLQVKVDSAAASAKLTVLRKELKDTAKAADDSQVGLKGRLMALGGTASGIIGLGDAFSLFSKDASMGAKVMSGFSLATGLLEAPMAGLIVGVGGLVAGLASAGLGLAAFGAVAKANFTTASTAASAVQTAQITYNAAIKSGAKQAAAYAAEQKAIGIAYAQLSPAQIQLSKNIGNAQNQWQSFVQSNTSGVSKILSQGIGLLPKVFAAMQPFMAPVEKALHGIIGELGKGLGSSGFKSFIDSMAKASGPMITNLAGAIGHVVVGIGGILKAFLPMAGTMTGGLDKITAKFAHWGSTLTSHSGFQSLVSMAKADMPYVIKIVKNLGEAIKNLGGSMTGLSTFSNSKALLQLATPLAQLVNWLSKANPALLRMGLYALAAHSAFGKVGSAVSGIKTGLGDLNKGINLVGKFGGAAEDAGRGAKLASGATKVWSIAQGALNVVMSLNPVALIVIAIGLLVAAIVLLVVKCKPFREFWIHLWKDAQHIFGVAIDWIKTHWKLLPAILLGPVGIAVTLVLTHFTQIKRGAMSLVHDVVSFFSSLPHKIISAVGDLGSLLLQGGKNLIMGLVHGIEAVAMAPVHAVESIVGGIRNLLPFSPAKKGPLSGSGSPDLAGRKIPLMLAGGIRSSTSAVASAATAMAGAAVTRPGAGRGAAGGGEIVLRIEGSDQSLVNALVLALRKDIRIKGGNVQTVLGH